MSQSCKCQGQNDKSFISQDSIILRIESQAKFSQTFESNSQYTRLGSTLITRNLTTIDKMSLLDSLESNNDGLTKDTDTISQLNMLNGRT